MSSEGDEGEGLRVRRRGEMTSGIVAAAGRKGKEGRGKGERGERERKRKRD